MAVKRKDETEIEMRKMNSKTEGAMAIIAALIVLFSAMWDARVSAAVAIIALAVIGIYELT
jgi:hypothetical protein